MINNHLLGIAPLSALATPPDEFIYLAKEIGFDFVGLRVVPVTATEPQFDLSVGSPLHKRVLAALADTGLEVKDAEFILIDGSDQRDLWRTAMERAASLGAATLTVAVGDEDRARVEDTVAAMVEDGRSFGVLPAIEAISYQAVHSIPDAVGLAEKSGAYFLPDTLHIHRFGGTPAELADATATGIVPMLQLCDALALRPEGREGLVWESRSKRMIPGTGAADLEGLLGAIPKDLPISVETPDDLFVDKHGAREWLRRLFEASARLVALTEKIPAR